MGREERGDRSEERGRVVLTIQQLINQNKVVLHRFLCNAPKVLLQYLHHLIQHLK